MTAADVKGICDGAAAFLALFAALAWFRATLIRRGRVLTALQSSLNLLPEIPTCLLLSMLDRTVGEINAGGYPRRAA